ncbi:MAG: hypothetical protein ACYTEW_22270 [Planctomycetota bacterium]
MRLKIIVTLLFLLGILVAPASAIKLQDIDMDLGIQYRLMYNYSNIGSTEQYDFFRHRLRVTTDIHTEEGVGAFMQIEFRGGLGGGSPEFSDPRGIYAINVFNRLQARGLRYGWLYFPLGLGTVNGGILALNDQVGQMIFSADWDFNVGGVSYAGKANGFDYRLAYVRLVEGIFYTDTTGIASDEDVHFVVVDLNTDLEAMNVGAHFYGMYGEICDAASGPATCDAATPLSDLNQTWIGPHFTANLQDASIHGVFLYNTGDRGATSTDGWLAKLEGSTKMGPAGVNILGIYSAGDVENGEATGFQTIEDIFGSNGYWGYSYIFLPHGPSDVNDFGLTVGNRGFGLTTIQGKIDFPVSDKVGAQVVAGYFKSNEDMIDSGGTNVGDEIGFEIGAQLAFNVGKYMNLEIGGAFASLEDAGKAIFQGNDEDSVNEIFSRLQLEF